MVSLDDVAGIATQLPEVVEIDRRGNRAWAVSATKRGGPTVFAWERQFSKADIRRYGAETPPTGPILAIRVADLHEKEAVLAANPDAFFTIPHFDGYAAVLVQLDEVTGPALRDAILDGWLACAPPELAERYRA
ncbi:MmcQ/YjbR family DNA-binding protein [Pseudonocardia adelaidensis]|uniref:MmcQ/YjbR family DNA-binding protein n=1 Tax=Pseudonocardia adelaidensis TaxID=648754 RepID=A0ABP9NKK9_9PSEU